MRPRLSVIIPVYNVEKYVRRCLDSVYGQTFQDFEVIMIDDGSPDNCGRILDEYAGRYNETFPTTVIHKKNAGLPSAWNDGLRSARGEWVTFVDSDDWLEKNYYESMFHALGDRDVDIFIAGGCFINKGNKQTASYCFDTQKLYQTREERDYMMTRVFVSEKKKSQNKTVVLGATQALWDKLFRNDFIKEHNLCFNLELGLIEDVLFNFIAFDQADCIGVSKVCGYHYRQVEQSRSKRFSPKVMHSYTAFLNVASDYLSGHGNNATVRSALNVYALRLLTGALSKYFCHPNNGLSKKEIAKEFEDYKKMTCFDEAIWDDYNPYISGKPKIWQISFRFPGFVLVKLLHKAKNTVIRIGRF